METSNALLNRFILNSKWSQLSNYNSVPTDCPHREYYGWSGDAQLFAESAMYHFDSAKMLGNYIAIMDDYQQTYGNYGQIMPCLLYTSKKSHAPLSFCREMGYNESTRLSASASHSRRLPILLGV